MLTRIRRLFAAPAFEDEFETRLAGLFNSILLIILAATVLGTVVVIPLEPAETVPNLIFGVIISAMILGLRRLLFLGRIKIISALLSALLWGAITYLVYSGEGARDPSLTGYFLVIALSGLLLGGWGAVAFGLLSWAAALGILGAEARGLLSFPSEPLGFMDAITLTLTMGLTLLLFNFAVRSVNISLVRARRNEQAQRQANRELEAIRASLEQRVAERTSDLERRSAQLRASAEVGRAAATIRNLDELVYQVVRLVNEFFGFEHVGLFLANEAGDQLLLKATNSEGGRQRLAQGYALQAGQLDIVSVAAEQKTARIALAQGRDAALIQSPCLPTVCSELALPLVAGNRLLGALDVQSSREAAFTQNDADVIQILADQLAVAIENAQLFTQSQAALEAERRAYGEMSRQGWQQMIRTQADRRYVCDSRGARAIASQPVQAGSAPAADHPLQSELLQAVHTGQTIQPDKATITIPIKIREHVLGAVQLCKAETAGEWTAGEMALTQTLTEQLSVALESARLYQDTQRRAAQEKLIGGVTARIRGTLDVETILKTAISEMRTMLNLAEVEVDIDPALAKANNSNPVEQPSQEQSNP